MSYIEQEIIKINARDCVVKLIDKDISKKFLEENHDQGYARSSIQYGLFINEDLVMCMTFGKPRFNRNYQWEIIRECTKSNCIVRGGTSKLWKHFVKNNKVSTCICYSYPHDGMFTDHYIKYCGFVNVKKAKKDKNVWYVGSWNGEEKRISKPLLERHGVDRLLKGDFGKGRSNEEILLSLGFEKIEEDGLSPQIDSYMPFGVCYKLIDLNTSEYYIGCCFEEERFDSEDFNEGGKSWNEHIRENKDHSYAKKILFERADNPTIIYKRLIDYIREDCFFDDEFQRYEKYNLLCLNTNYDLEDIEVCYECGCIGNNHNNNCSQYKME